MMILKRILNKIFSFLDLILYYNTEQSGIFGKVKEVILHK